MTHAQNYHVICVQVQKGS